MFLKQTTVEESRKVLPKAKEKRARKTLGRMYKDRYLYLMMFPVLVFFFIFKYIPMYGTIIAFKDFRFVDGIMGSEFVGLKHFIRLFSSEDFYRIFANTLLLNVYNVIFSFPVPIILAILLNEVRNRWFKKSIQSILYIPHFISWVVLGGIIINILSPSSGVINQILKACGAEPIYFMRSSFWWIVVFVCSTIWQTAGWGTIVYLAAITSIDAEQYDAAVIDGANKWQQITKITLPSIRGTIAIMLILRMGQMLDVGFEQIYMLQNDAVLNVSDVISTYEYRVGLEGMQYSYTAALGLFKGLIGLILITSTNYIVRRLGENGLW